MHRLFSVTNGLIALLAAGMAGQAAAILHGADLLPGWGERLWDTSALLSDDSLIGRTLHALSAIPRVPRASRSLPGRRRCWCWSAPSLAISRPRGRTLAAAAALTFAGGGPSARADDLPVLVFHNHRFEPTGSRFRRTPNSSCW